MLSVPDFAHQDPIIGSYASNLDDFIRKHDIALWLHSHIHSNSDYKLHGCKGVSNPRGYVGYEINPDFNESLVVELPTD